VVEADCGRNSVIAGWLKMAVYVGAVMPALFAGAVSPAAPTRVSVVNRSVTRVSRRIVAAHDFHVSYTRMAVEGSSISAQIRMFGDDITKALVSQSKTPALVLNSVPGQAAAQAYLAAAFPILANGRALVPVIVSATQERDMWSYIVTWTAAAPITSLSMHNAAMMEYFDDQQNIVKVKYIGSGTEATLFYSGGSRADQVVKF
jgi:hypothetical protein